MSDATAATNRKKSEFVSSEMLAAELEKLCKEQENEKTPKYAPLPLQRPTSPAKPYPFDALGPIAGAAARRIHEVVQAPDATCGQSILAALSLACQGFIDVQIDGRLYPTSLFLLTISESGERKSAADKIALKPINDRQKMLVEQHKKLLPTYKHKCEIWKVKQGKAINTAAKNSASEPISFEPELEPPCEGLLLCEEPTLEGLEQLLERGQPSAGIFSDEGGRLVGGHAMNAENALKTACGLSNLWDGKPLTRVRKSEPSKIHYGRRLSVHLMIQPIVLMKLLNNEMLMGQGLLSRCLFSAPSPIAGTRRYQEVDLSTDPAILIFYDLINKILNIPYPKTDHELRDNNAFAPKDSLKPKPLLLEGEAKKRWITFHDETDSKMNKSGEFNIIKSFASKAPEQVLRIAAQSAFSESSLDPTTETMITLHHIERAITLILYYLDEALRILGENCRDPNIDLATQTLEWIQKNRDNQTFPIADIYQNGPSKIRNVKTAKQVLHILQDHELVKEIKDATIDGRKVRSAWQLVSHADDG